ETGFYSAGEFLPTERALAEDLRVHRRVVRAAIDELVREGMISQKPHCRPVVGQSEEETQSAAAVPTRDAGALPASNLVALIMWHGGGRLERAGTSQARVFWGVNDQLAEANYHAVFLDLGRQPGSEEETAECEAAQLNYALEHGFGGVIFYPYAYRSNRDLVKRIGRRIPVVMLDRVIGGLDVNFVGVDNYSAMFEMTTHLLAQGHRRIAYITKNEPIHPVQDRLQGYIGAVRGAGAPEMVVTIPSTDNLNEPWPIVDAMFRLPVGERPTAAVCFNDYTAVNVAAHLEKLGLMVPTDVAVTGFDNIIQTLPSGLGLTTIAQPYEEIGQRAAQLLLSRHKNPLAATEFVEMPSQLIVRDSTPDLNLP
ncbi:MAG: regulatory protein LacI:Periplasmic binding protein/LacI transcriptional regulator, partial [Capsulimonas sp.]|nr:regulatory protein LacI:Periplasmic binding protein/LacI transcriptional regulator [Capsulimonas sp.]